MDSGVITQQDTTILKQMVTSLLREKPSDPVPFIYNFLAQVKSGIDKPNPLSNI